MITNERVVSFIHSLESSNGAILDQIEIEALTNEVPIIRKETQSFLKTMITLLKPRRILEIGTAVGFSSLLMCEFAPVDCRIVTIENYAPRIPIARENFKRMGREEQITLVEGDAVEVLQELVEQLELHDISPSTVCNEQLELHDINPSTEHSEQYDLIFMDAAKAQYPMYLPYTIKLLKPGGVLLTDNVLQDGELIQSKYIIERRQRTIHKRMREYLYDLKHHELLETTILPLGDGLAMSVLK